MRIIRSLRDIRKLAAEGTVSCPLAAHLTAKVERLRAALAPEVPPEAFDMGASGTGIFGLLEPGDRDLSGIGIMDLAGMMPEFVTKLVLGAETFYVVYLMVDNDAIDQAYLPDALVEGELRLWLVEQPLEEEPQGGEPDDDQVEPF